jgi:hypothetical protein
MLLKQEELPAATDLKSFRRIRSLFRSADSKEYQLLRNLAGHFLYEPRLSSELMRVGRVDLRCTLPQPGRAH